MTTYVIYGPTAEIEATNLSLTGAADNLLGHDGRQWEAFFGWSVQHGYDGIIRRTGAWGAPLEEIPDSYTMGANTDDVARKLAEWVVGEEWEGRIAATTKRALKDSVYTLSGYLELAHTPKMCASADEPCSCCAALRNAAQLTWSKPT